MKTDYRVTQNRNEILSLLKASQIQEAFVWQNIPEGRLKYSIASLFFDYVRDEIKIVLKDYKFDLNDTKPLYLKFEKRDLLIKADITQLVNNFAFVKIPDEVMADELRSDPRTFLSIQNRNTVTLNIPSQVTKGAVQSFDFHLADISSGGFSILFHKGLKHILDNLKEVQLIKINNSKLKSSINTQLKYSNPIKKKGVITDFYKAGFQCDIENEDNFIKENLIY